MFKSPKPTCEIHFTDNKSVFNTNEKVSGTVALNNDKIINLSSIDVEFLGFAKVKFFVPDESKRHPIVHKGNQSFISETKNLWRGNILSEGGHKFNFYFFIPFEMPASVEADHQEFYNKDNDEALINFKTFGFIRYVLMIKLLNDDKIEFLYEFPITVIKNYDLNFAKETLRNPIQYQDFKKFKFSSKSLCMKAGVPAGGFVCGQKVEFNIQVENDSSVDIKAFKIELVRVFLYISNEPEKRPDSQIARKSVASIAIEGLPGKTIKDIKAFLNIPCVPPSSEGLCKILELSYEFHVTAKFKGLHSSLVLKMPIVIGTVPFVWNDNLPAYDFRVNAGASTSSASSSPAACDIPPPSYMEAVGTTLTQENEQAGLR